MSALPAMSALFPDRACAICTKRASSVEVLRKPLTPRERRNTMIKLRSLIGAALAAWLVAPAAVMAQKQLHIIVVTHGAASDSFWAPVKNGADEGGKETGSLVEYRAPEKFDMVAMAQLIEASAAAKPDGLIVTIPDADALAGSDQSSYSVPRFPLSRPIQGGTCPRNWRHFACRPGGIYRRQGSRRANESDGRKEGSCG